MTAPATNNTKAIAWTVSVHALLLLLFFLLKYSLPLAPLIPDEGGIEVNLGSSNDGFGTDQPQNPEDPSESDNNSHRSSASTSTAMPDMLRDNDAENPSVPASAQTAAGTNATAPRNARNNQETNPTQNTRPAQQPRFVMHGGNGRGGNGAMQAVPGGAEGNTTGSGDRGVAHGTPGATNYTGTPGSGTGGIAFSLKDRSIVAYPAREAEFREGGKVMVRVTVNRAGVIVNTNVLSATNAELRPIALRKLQSLRFNKSDDAPQEQFGTITFMFRAGQ